MHANRKSLLTFAAIATLAVSLATAAQAGGRFTPFCHKGPPNFARYIPAPPPSRIASVRSNDDDAPARPTKRHSPAAAPVKSKSVAVVAAASPAAAATPTCLTKEYLDTGAVMFRDTCTKEWAMNSTSIDKVSAAGRTCLTKENNQDGVVVFKDICTKEWAMNTIEQQAQDPQTR